MSDHLQFSPFTGNVFRRPAGQPLAQAGGLPPLRRAGGTPFPFDRIPLLEGGMGDSVSKPFEQSAWVLRAIKEISGPIAAVELKFYAGDTEITDAPWLKFWRQPVRNLSGADFIEALVGWLKLNGEAFLILPPELTKPFPEVATGWPQLLLARPDCMRAEVSSTGELLGWEYLGSKGQRMKLTVEQVIQPRFWNPYDPIRGLSEYESARVATEADYLAGKFALNLARANGDTGVIVSVKGGGIPDDAQQKQITSALRLKQQKSQRGEFSSIFVPADLEVQDPKVRVMDAAQVAQRLENRHEIYLAFGVPPSMADIAASYSVGSASDWYRLITGTCIPTACKIAEAISQVASRMHGQEVEAYFEFDEHPVMQTVRRERIDAGTKLFDRGLPWQTVSEYLDLDLPKFAGDDVGYIPFSLTPVGSAEAAPDPSADPAFSETEDDAAPVQEMLRALKQRAAEQRAPSSKKLWEAHMRTRQKAVRLYQSRASKVFNDFRAVALQHFFAANAGKSVITRSVLDLIFDPAAFGRALVAQMNPIARSVLQTAGTELLAEIGKADDPWTMPPAEALRFINERKEPLEKVARTARGQLNTALESALNEGLSTVETADKIRSVFNDLSKHEAKRIAMTETSASYGSARHQAMKDAGVQFKSWLSSHGPNVRPAHAAAELTYSGTPIPVNEPFKVGGEDLMYPGDSKGRLDNIINCQCVQIAVAAPEPKEEPA